MPEESLMAGVGVRDITPDPGVPLWGYMDRTGPATGTLDKLFARVLVFRTAKDTIAIIALDLGRTPAARSLERIQRYASERHVDMVFCVATHTHHAPVMELEDLPHAIAIEHEICEALDLALHDLKPVTLEWGTEILEIGHNRREVRDGTCLMRWRNEERIPTSPVDNQMTVVRVRALSGDDVALLVHHACHPVIMGPGNLEYSADWPGEMCRVVKETTNAECLFLQGACGDINPYLDKTPLDAGAVEAMRETGRMAARAVLQARQNSIRCESQPAIRHQQNSLKVGVRWNFQDERERGMFSAFYGPFYEQFYLHGANADLELPISVVVLNDTLLLAGVPGEPFVHYQLALKEAGPARVNLMCGYTNGYQAYFPTVRAALTGGYGGTVGSFVGIGAMDNIFAEINRMGAEVLGQIGRPAAPEDFDIHDLP